MNEPNFTTTIVVDQSPKQVFDAITNVRGWWSEEIEGNTAHLNDEFLYHYKDVHISKMKLTEVIPDKKIVWEVMKNHFNFTRDESEWTGNKVVFDITKKGDTTELQFTQIGLVPSYECYDICRQAWTNYINTSLYDLITKGKGQPNPKEGGFNQEIVDKYLSKKN